MVEFNSRKSDDFCDWILQQCKMCLRKDAVEGRQVTSKENHDTAKKLQCKPRNGENMTVCDTRTLSIIADLVFVLNTDNITKRDEMLCFCNSTLSQVNYTNVRSKVLVDMSANTTEYITSSESADARILEIFKSHNKTKTTSISEIRRALPMVFEEKPDTDKVAVVISEEGCNKTVDHSHIDGQDITVVEITIATDECHTAESESPTIPCIFQFKINETEELYEVGTTLQTTVCNASIYQSVVCNGPSLTTRPYITKDWPEVGWDQNYTQAPSSKSSLNVGLVVGSVVGALVFAVVLIMFIVFRKCKKSSKDKRDQRNTFHEYSFVDQSVFSRDSYGDPFEAEKTGDKRSQSTSQNVPEVEEHTYDILNGKEDISDKTEPGHAYHTVRRVPVNYKDPNISNYDHVNLVLDEEADKKQSEKRCDEKEPKHIYHILEKKFVDISNISKNENDTANTKEETPQSG